MNIGLRMQAKGAKTVVGGQDKGKKHPILSKQKKIKDAGKGARQVIDKGVNKTSDRQRSKWCNTYGRQTSSRCKTKGFSK